MPRYVKRPRGWIEDDVFIDGRVPDIQVADHEAVNTGLLDATGDEIWRAPNPIGFGRDEDW